MKIKKAHIGFILLIVLLLLFIFKPTSIIGISIGQIEQDARESQKIDDTWAVSKSVNRNIGAMLFYNDTRDKFTFSIYLNHPGFSFGYFFAAGGATGSIEDGISKLSYGNNSLVLISMNVNEISTIELDNGVEIKTIAIDPAKPFAEVIPNNCDEIKLYDVEGNEVPIDDVSASDQLTETVALEVNKDIDGNGIIDAAQIIERNDGTERFVRIFFNGEQIYEYEDPNVRIMSVEAFECPDLDGDNRNEIFVTADTNANGRPLMDVLCLKQNNDSWSRMNVPINETGNNGFSFQITRGKDEFDFIISSKDTDQEIYFDAAPLFVDDESIQAYRKNNYKEGDEVGFISTWGIWEAKTGTYNGRNCIIALQGIEGPYGHSLGQINTYFSYNEQGNVEILNIEYQ